MRLSSRHAITPFLFFGEFVKGLSFSIESSTLALRRGGDLQRSRRPRLPSRLQHNDCFRGIQEPLLRGESPAEQSGVTTRQRCRHHALHASLPTTTAGLPSLAGLPSANNNSNNNNAPPSPSNGSGGRSRRGKYPVIELYRRDADGSTTADTAAGIVGGGGSDDDDDDGLAGGSLPYGRRGGVGARRSVEPQATAVDHLRSVLGLASDQVDMMLESFPTLAHVDPDKLGLPAKLRFLRHTIGAEVRTVAVSFPQFFGHPLERLIAPRHAFLVSNGRPSGDRLLETGCRGLRRMLELPVNRFVVEMVPGREVSDYRRFEQAFLRGPFDAARKGDGETLRLLRSHGWDCWETDRRGRTALFWAAGGGSVEACKALVEGEGGLRPQDSGGDGSTPLHWAVAGVETRRFGTGGHVNVCRWLLDLGVDTKARTSEGNTVVMWAAWAGGLDATRWAVEEAGALDVDAANANGCTVAHWASSGGDEAVCRCFFESSVQQQSCII
ncbi:conserved unknown protein [Ectocarpus siliculosus]|uniref:Uncharacterized protein n=1 Tax=Ectocarpus siliculosus TaxID=2880 RepID=D8LGD8_ECTSI|nr:conserved unknown protein [Ectocarpus siliculosus]|eukprot:CBN75713.1 conserved unknown protein [Ectocarpus siliculosus]